MGRKQKLRAAARRAEVRATGDTDGTWSRMTAGGIGSRATPMNARLAENLSAVLGCVQAIAGAISAFPLFVYRETGAAKVEDRAHPLARLVRRGPNRYQSMVDWLEWTMGSVLLRGNAVSELVRDGAGGVVELKPIPWEWCRVQMLGNGRLVYDINEISSVYGGTGKTRRLLEDDVVHLRDRSDDGVIGLSRLVRAAGAMESAMSVQHYDNAQWTNGLRPSGVVAVEHPVTPELMSALQQRLNERGGAGNAGKVLVLDRGMKWDATTITPHDAELLLSRRFTVEEICRIYGVPPVVVGDLTNSSFNNSETLLLAFAQLTLRGWVTKLEHVLGRAVFSDEDIMDHRIEFDMSDYLRGDPLTRWKNNQIAVDSGILTPDEIRELEGYGPIDGGGELRPRAATKTPAGGTASGDGEGAGDGNAGGRPSLAAAA